MPTMTWSDHFNVLAKEYPPLTINNPQYPSLGAALDDGIDKILADFLAGGGSEVNRRFVEDLLNDCVERISNALVLREKANDVEVKAVHEAMSHSYQTKLLETTKKINDLLGPTQAMSGMNAVGLKAEAGGFKFVGDESLWDDLKKLQDSIFKDQSEQLSTGLAKAVAPGNGANFVERFSMLKALFDLGMPELYGRCLACAFALKKIYGIDLPVPKVTSTGYLNQLAIWGQKASDRLDVELGSRYTGEVMFAIAGVNDNLRDGELLSRTKYTQAVQTGTLNFSITEKHFERFKISSPLLRSVRLHLRPKAEDGRIRIWTGTVSPPDSELTPGDEIFPCIVPSSYAQADGEAVFGVHNLNPVGDWVLRLAEQSVAGDVLNADEVQNVFLRMRVSYRRKGA